MLNKVGTFFQWLVLTFIGRYIIGFVVMIIGFVGTDKIEDPNSVTWSVFWWLGWLGCAVIAVQILIFMVYAWIINPLAGWRAAKKAKADAAATKTTEDGK